MALHKLGIAVAAAVIASACFSSAADAHHWHHHGGGGWGWGAFGVGLGTGLLVGGAPYWGGYRGGYRTYAYAGDCYWSRRWVHYNGHRVLRRVRVCY